MATDHDEQKKHKSNEIDLELVLFQHIEGQISRSDTKTQFTLAINAVLIASLGKEGKIAMLGNTAQQTSGLEALLSIIMFVFLLLSTFAALFAVMPKLTSPKQVDNFFYFASISNRSEKKFAEDFAAAQGNKIREMMLSEIHALASIANRKFKRIRISYAFLLGALIFWTFIQFLPLF